MLETCVRKGSIMTRDEVEKTILSDLVVASRWTGQALWKENGRDIEVGGMTIRIMYSICMYCRKAPIQSLSKNASE